MTRCIWTSRWLLKMQPDISAQCPALPNRGKVGMLWPLLLSLKYWEVQNHNPYGERWRTLTSERSVTSKHKAGSQGIQVSFLQSGNVVGVLVFLPCKHQQQRSFLFTHFLHNLHLYNTRRLQPHFFILSNRGVLQGDFLDFCQKLLTSITFWLIWKAVHVVIFFQSLVCLEEISSLKTFFFFFSHVEEMKIKTSNRMDFVLKCPIDFILILQRKIFFKKWVAVSDIQNSIKSYSLFDNSPKMKSASTAHAKHYKLWYWTSKLRHWTVFSTASPDTKLKNCRQDWEDLFPSHYVAPEPVVTKKYPSNKPTAIYQPSTIYQHAIMEKILPHRSRLCAETFLWVRSCDISGTKITNRFD